MSSSSAKYLLNAFEQRNIGKFQEALEVFKMDPNDIDGITNRTVFETILSESQSTEFIKVCLQNDADFYMVSWKLLITQIHLLKFHHLLTTEKQ